MYMCLRSHLLGTEPGIVQSSSGQSTQWGERVHHQRNGSRGPAETESQVCV